MLGWTNMQLLVGNQVEVFQKITQSNFNWNARDSSFEPPRLQGTPWPTVPSHPVGISGFSYRVQPHVDKFAQRVTQKKEILREKVFKDFLKLSK